jgi:hypothetical protein
MVAVLLCAAPGGWSKTPKAKGSRKLVWVGLVVAGAGAAVFATSGHTVTTPQQCTLVPLATICVPARTYTDHRQWQQVTGAGMVLTGGVMVWQGLPGK